MTIFKKDGPPQPTKIQKRVANIPTSELITWAENALYMIGKEVTGWSRTRNADLLEEADLGAEALYAITQELKKRAASGL